MNRAAMTMVLVLTAGVGILAVWLGLGRTQDSSTQATVANVRPSPQSNGDAFASRAVAKAADALDSGPFHWSRIITNDYRIYTARLRSIGCPEATIQDIIIGAINRRFSSRIAALRANGGHFWDTLQRRNPGDLPARLEREREARNLERERSQLVSDVLGIQLGDYFSAATAKPDRLSELSSVFSDGSRSQARQILERYDQQEREVVDKVNGTLGPKEQSQIRQLYQQKLAELSQVVSAKELEDYQLRASPIAETLRNSELVGFSPTEQEFRAIFRVRNGFEEKSGPDSRLAASEDQSALQVSVQDAEEQIRQALGDARYADYRRSQDFVYRGLVEFADYNGLPTETANQVQSLRETVIQQVGSLTAGDTLPMANRQMALKQIQAEAAKTVEQALGSEAYGEYVKAPFGQWISLIPTWTNQVAFGR